MRFLLLLLLGTLIFGFAFPAMLLMMALFGVLLIGLIIYRFLKGSSNFTVYTSKDFNRRNVGEDYDDDDRRAYGGRKKVNAGSAARGPQQSAQQRDPSVENIAMEEEDIEESCEVVELPATALRKDDEPPKAAESEPGQEKEETQQN